ncbi:MAG: putative lipid II flippase FtsW [Opitutales bacterium]|nr:putative lipid II flippase FtsW [Opitutales bacterium]
MDEDFHEELKTKAGPGWEGWLMLLIVGILIVFGIFVQSSAGYAHKNSDHYYTFYHQLGFLFPALLCFFVATKINFKKICENSFLIWSIYAGAIVLAASVFVPGVGLTVKGACRWIHLGFFNLQVSDPAKIALTLVMAHYLSVSQRYFQTPNFKWWRLSFSFIPNLTREGWLDLWRGLILPTIILGGIVAPIGLEPDLGTSILCVCVVYSLLFVANARMRFVLPVCLTGLAGLGVLIYNWPNRLARVTSFMNPEKDVENTGYQLWQALVALASGRATGKGFGEGIQCRGFLPEAHTDCVFAIIGEEFGFVVCVTIALAFLFLFLLGIDRLRRITDVFYFNLCLGSLLFIVLQACVNMFVITGMAPTKGMSLPFISYGGSNLVTMCIFVGIIFNVFCRSRENGILPPPVNL